MAQSLSICSTNHQRSFQIPFISTVLISASLDTHPPSTNSDPLFPAANLDTNTLVYHLIPLRATTAEPLVFGNRRAWGEAIDVPAITTSPEAPPWILIPEQGYQGSSDPDPATIEGPEGYELVNAAKW